MDYIEESGNSGQQGDVYDACSPSPPPRLQDVNIQTTFQIWPIAVFVCGLQPKSVTAWGETIESDGSDVLSYGPLSIGSFKAIAEPKRF